MAAATLLMTFGCELATAPQPAPGTYVLRSVAGDPLPTVQFATEYITVRVLADTLRLRADGTGTERILQQAHLSTSTIPEPPEARESDVRYRTRRNRIELEYICPPNALCAAPPHLRGRLARGGLVFDYALGMRAPLVYERIAD